jgi:hypothetical protein
MSAGWISAEKESRNHKIVMSGFPADSGTPRVQRRNSDCKGGLMSALSAKSRRVRAGPLLRLPTAHPVDRIEESPKPRRIKMKGTFGW